MRETFCVSRYLSTELIYLQNMELSPHSDTTSSPTSNEIQPKLLTPEEADKLLQRRPNLSKDRREFFDRENVRAIEEILYDPELLELDKMCFTGAFPTTAEYYEYITQISIIQKAEHRSSEVGARVADYLTSTLPKFFADTRTFLEKNDGKMSERTPLVALLNGFQHFANAYTIREESTIRNVMVKNLIKSTLSLLLFRIGQTAMSGKNPQDKAIMEGLLRKLKSSKSPGLVQYSGIIAVTKEILNGLQTIFRNPDGLRNSYLSSTTAPEDIPTENDLLADRVDTLSCFRDCGYYSEQFGPITVQLLPSQLQGRFRESEKVGIISNVRIYLRAGAEVTEQNIGHTEVSLTQELPETVRSTVPNTIDLSVARPNGELDFLFSSIPLSAVLDKSYYTFLQNIVLKTLLAHLETLPDTVKAKTEAPDKTAERALIASLAEEARAREEAEFNIQAAEYRKAGKDAALNKVFEKEQRERVAKTQKKAEEDKRELENKLRAEKKYVDDFILLKTHSCREIHGALTKLFGPPITGGRHPKYKDSKTGITSPVPKHGGGMATGTLKSVLEIFDIDPIVLLDLI